MHLDFDDLSSLFFGMAVFGLLLVCFGAGLYGRRYLPPKHQTHESLEIVHAVIAMLVAMIAILLGLQLESANKSFETMGQGLDRYSFQIIQLDAFLREYGTDAEPIRKMLQDYTSSATSGLEEGDGSESHAQGLLLRRIGFELLNLKPTDAAKTRLQSDGLTLIGDMFHVRWELISGSRSATNLPLYLVLLFWMMLVYMAFGLNAPFNAPAFVVLFLSAAAIGAAVFVLSDMNTPFGGLISVSPHAMEEALAHIRE